MFLIRIEVRGHTVPHLNGLRYDKDDSRGLSCGYTSSICQDILKSDQVNENHFMNKFFLITSLCTEFSIVFSMEVMHFSAKRGRTCHLIPISVRISTDDWHANEGKP